MKKLLLILAFISTNTFANQISIFVGSEHNYETIITLNTSKDLNAINQNNLDLSGSCFYGPVKVVEQIVYRLGANSSLSVDEMTDTDIFSVEIVDGNLDVNINVNDVNGNSAFKTNYTIPSCI